MPRRCTVCTHPKREEIDRLLVARGGTFRAIARQFRVGKDSLIRHHDDHLPATLTKAREAEEHARADDLLERLLSLNAETLAILQAAKRAKDHALALAAIARAEKQLELQARLAGELTETATVNVLVSPEWRAVQAVILEVLAPHPALRQQVAAALLESAAAPGASNGNGGGGGAY